MPTADISQLIDYFREAGFVLWGPFFALLLSGLGFPLPEELLLLVAGYLSESHSTSFGFTLLVMYMGVVIGDICVYSAGRLLGTRLLRTRLGLWIISPTRMKHAVDLLAKFGFLVLFIGRFTPGLRTPIFFTAGSLRYPFYRFILLDAIGAIFSVLVFVSLGAWSHVHFGDNLERIQESLGGAQGALLGVVFFVGLGAALWIWKARKPSLSDGQ